jgi:AmmeMemoRadiSam system protein B
VAAHAYLRLAEAREPEVVVIVGPDHHGAGPAVALAPQARWQTPLGEVVTDHPARAALASGGIPEDDLGHRHEHSVEVQVPFLQVLGYQGAVVPVVMADQDHGTAMRLAGALSGALAGLEATMIASSDLSHYLPHEQAVRVDRAALAALVTGDARHLLREVERRAISMCGAGPVAAVLEAARRLGTGPVEVLRYATSGEVAGDRESVVGYVAASLGAA